jgi:hypothetical protein
VDPGHLADQPVRRVVVRLAAVDPAIEAPGGAGERYDVPAAGCRHGDLAADALGPGRVDQPDLGADPVLARRVPEQLLGGVRALVRALVCYIEAPDRAHGAAGGPGQAGGAAEAERVREVLGRGHPAIIATAPPRRDRLSDQTTRLR